MLLAAVAGAGTLLAQTLIPMGEVGDGSLLNVPLLLLIPLAAAVVTTVGVHSPFGALDAPAG